MSEPIVIKPFRGSKGRKELVRLWEQATTETVPQAGPGETTSAASAATGAVTPGVDSPPAPAASPVARKAPKPAPRPAPAVPASQSEPEAKDANVVPRFARRK